MKVKLNVCLQSCVVIHLEKKQLIDVKLRCLKNLMQMFIFNYLQHFI